MIIIQHIPDESWVARLRQGDHIWLVKERQIAIIEGEYQGPLSGAAGRIGFRRAVGSVWRSETWVVRASGKGFDFGQLFLPIEGHLSDCPPSSTHSEIREIYREMNDLGRRIQNLEAVIAAL